tara:strand:- start:264 stop:530 length:267 start_codon:yes stop_codon:yes gene_type:complete
MAKKSDHIVTITSTITKTEKYLICGEDKDMAKYIATDQNQSPRYDCTLVEETESDPFDTEVNVKEVVFTKRTDFKGQKEDKYFWKEIE